MNRPTLSLKKKVKPDTSKTEVKKSAAPVEDKAVVPATKSPAQNKKLSFQERCLNPLNWLQTTFPKTFVRPSEKPLPLKVGLGKDLTAYVRTHEVSHSLKNIRIAINYYINAIHYQKALAQVGTARIDLEGNLVGEVTEREAERAKEQLEARPKPKKRNHKNKQEQPEKLPNSSPDIKATKKKTDKKQRTEVTA